MLTTSFCIQATAAESRTTNYVDKVTSGGKNGKVTIRFRCTCVQESIATNYSWSSSMTLPSGITGFTYKQTGAVTLSDHSQKAFTAYSATYNKTYQNALIGGYSDMYASASAFGSASQKISVTR